MFHTEWEDSEALNEENVEHEIQAELLFWGRRRARLGSERDGANHSTPVCKQPSLDPEYMHVIKSQSHEQISISRSTTLQVIT